MSTDPGLYQALFELSSDPMLVVDGSRVVDANRRALAILGETRDALVGRALSSILASTQPDGRSSVEVAAALVTPVRGSPLPARWLLEGEPSPAPVKVQRFALGDRQLVALSWHPEARQSPGGGRRSGSREADRVSASSRNSGVWRGEQGGRPIAGASDVEGEDAALPGSQSGDLPPHAWVVPVQAGGQTIGVLGVSGEPQLHLAEEDRQLLESISRQASEALQRARLLEEAQERAHRERLIRDISDRMQRATDLESLLRAAAQGLAEALKASRVYVRMGTFEELGEE